MISYYLKCLFSSKNLFINIYDYFLPGAIATEVTRDLSPEQLKKMFEDFSISEAAVRFKTIEQGASTTVWAAVAPELDGVGGKYLEDCQLSRPSTKEEIIKETFGYLDYSFNLNNALKLWDLTTDWIKAK